MNAAQELSKAHYQIALARTRLWHRLRKQYFLALYFPEIERFMRSIQVDRLVEFLHHFPHAGDDHVSVAASIH